jgi:hypothetical protein
LLEEFTEVDKENFPESYDGKKVSYDIEGFDDYKMIDFFYFLKEKLCIYLQNPSI